MGMGSDRHWHIYVVSVDGGSPEQLTVGTEGQVDPSWSPDGNSLAFAINPGSSGEYSIHMLDLKARRAAEVVGSRQICCPRWSPDGWYIAAIRLPAQGLTLFDFTTQKWRALNTEIINVNFMMWSR